MLIYLLMQPAAFRRLCVETLMVIYFIFVCGPAAFRRLCVETMATVTSTAHGNLSQPPLGGCVLKQGQIMGVKRFNGPAAFRRLCVETCTENHAPAIHDTSRL